MHALLRSRAGGALTRISKQNVRYASGSKYTAASPPPKQDTIAKPEPGTEYVPPKDEPMGFVFYASVATAIGTGLFMKMQPEDGETSLTQKFRRWHAAYNETWDARNNLHAKLTEKAAIDKALFYDTRHIKTIPLRNAETFNNYSPWNQEIGWQQGKIEEVKAHYWAAHADRNNGSF